jgi:hypothetical protein
MLAGQHTRGNLKNNDPSLTEPIAGAGYAQRIGDPEEAR